MGEVMTVRELIAALEALGPEALDLPVVYVTDTDIEEPTPEVQRGAAHFLAAYYGTEVVTL